MPPSSAKSLRRRVFGISKRRVAGQHFAHRPTRVKISAKSAERFVRNARHRGECNGIVDNVAADAHGQTAVMERAAIVQFLSRVSNGIYF